MRSLSVLLGLWLALGTAALGETYVVFPDGSGDFPTIQAAVDSVLDGDIIELADGVFRGEGNWDVDYLGKEITIRSQSGDPYACIVDCEAVGQYHRGFFFDNVGAGAVLAGITVRNGYADDGGGIICLGSSSPLISRCVFHRNTAVVHGGGIVCDVGSSPTISQCTFVENVATDGGGLCI